MSQDIFIKHIWLVGFSGSGKSTVGPKLATLMRMEFIDTDAEIEKIANCSLSELFAKHGEKRFRKLESQAISKVAKEKRETVVALGGGAFQSPENRAIMQRSGITAYLKTSVPVIYRRLSSQTDRPLLQVRRAKGETLRAARLARIKEMITRREPQYRLANIIVSTSSKNPTEVARVIMQKVRGKRG